MQTLAIQIDDSYMEQFMNFVKESHSKVNIHKDKNLEMDPYFYERRAKLHQTLEDIESGKMEMLSEEQYENEMEDFFRDLKNKHENHPFT